MASAVLALFAWSLCFRGGGRCLRLMAFRDGTGAAGILILFNILAGVHPFILTTICEGELPLLPRHGIAYIRSTHSTHGMLASLASPTNSNHREPSPVCGGGCVGCSVGGFKKKKKKKSRMLRFAIWDSRY